MVRSQGKKAESLREWQKQIPGGMDRKKSKSEEGGRAAALFLTIYQTRQFLAGVMGWPSLQPKAGPKPGWLTMAPLARK